MPTIIKRLATLDIETTDGLKGSQFGVGGFYMPEIDALTKELDYNSILYDDKDFIIETDQQKFFKKVLEKMEGKKVLCFIQHEDFDIRFIIKYLNENLIQYSIMQTDGKMLQLSIKDTNIIFRDSLQFLLCGQAEAEKVYLGKQIKKEVDFTKVLIDLQSSNLSVNNRAKEILYDRVKTDVKGLYDTMLEYKNIFLQDEISLNIFNYSTLPAFSIAKFKKWFKQRFGIDIRCLNPYFELKKGSYTWKQNGQMLLDWTRLSYYGGRNEAYYLHLLKNVYYYDENSLYPSVCINKPFPNPIKSRVRKITIEEFYKDIKGKKLYIIEAKVNENIFYPILPLRDIDGLVKFVNGIKKGVWCSPEFERFLDFEENKILEIVTIRIYDEEEFYLSDYMKTKYYQKLEYKKQNKPALVQKVKIDMNSLTGKFGQRYYFESWVLSNDEDLTNNIEEKEVLDYVVFPENYLLLKQEHNSFRDFMLVEWISFITSYSRCEMHKRIYDCIDEGIQVYYIDTDCLFTDKPLELSENMSKYIGIEPLQLKNELVKGNFIFNEHLKKYVNLETNEQIDIPFFDEAKFILPKVYLTKRNDEITIKCKGIDTFMIYETLDIPLNKDSESKALFNKKVTSIYQAERLLREGVQQDRYLKYKSSLRRNKKIVSHAVIKKSIKKKYDKRKVLDDLKTVPFTVEDLGELLEPTPENSGTQALNMFD